MHAPCALTEIEFVILKWLELHVYDWIVNNIKTHMHTHMIIFLMKAILSTCTCDWSAVMGPLTRYFGWSFCHVSFCLRIFLSLTISS